MQKLLLILSFFYCSHSFSQGDTTRVPSKNSTISFVHPEAKFPGGDRALAKFISEHFETDCYTQIDSSYTSRIYFVFHVDTNGRPVQPQILQRETRQFLDAPCYQSLLDKMPDWIPAESKGRKMKMRLSLPITVDWE